MLASEAHDALGSALFLDVREPYEFEAGRIEGSLNVPIGEIGANWQTLPAGNPVVVVCQIGQRSGLVAEFLCSKGLDAQNLEGGLTAWTCEGLPLASGSSPPRIVDGFARDLSGKRMGSSQAGPPSVG